jgi:hypothetical protein
VASPDAQHPEWRVVKSGFHIWEGDDPVEARRQADEHSKGRGLVGVLLRIVLIAEYLVDDALGIVVILALLWALNIGPLRDIVHWPF